ncbi:MAG: flavin-containing monooxygenase [Sphingomonadaceae bacterium]
MELFDVLIVGAGLSGIGAAWHLRDKCPGKTFAILEARDAIGGTWDLFRYPGIRSDSDMFTLGYNFRPWTAQKAIADGPDILAYVNDTAREAGIDPHIRFRHRVIRADFDSAAARWTVTAETPEGERQFGCRLLLMAAGYYSYENPHNPPIPGEERFGGTLFHAQHWPKDLDHRGKRVVVIGSGATAVTIVPSLAKSGAAHVTMLQRSPTWMVSRPSEDWFANLLRKLLPPMTAYNLIRWRNTFWQQLVFWGARRDPAKANRRMTDLLRKELPEEVIQAHFQPRYNVWEQRLCLVPDSDFFEAMRAGRAEVVTDRIESIDETGIRLESGRHLDADIIVKATGLRLQVLGGATVSVDGEVVRPAERFVYRGMMLEGVPNLVYVFGYFNASWTLRADLTCEWACKLLGEMDRRGLPIVVPERDREIEEEPLLLTSGYVQRGQGTIPKQGVEDPWRDTQDYFRDRKAIRSDRFDDPALRFRPARQPAAAPLLAEAAE